MALTEDNGMVMPVAPIYGNGGGNGSGGMGWGGDWGWIILLLLLAGNGWGGGFGGGFGGGAGAMALGYDFPWLMTGQQGINSNTNYGFQNALLNDNVTSIRDGVSNLSTQLCNCCGDIAQQLCNGFAGVNATVSSGFANAETAANTRQMATMQQAFAAQTAMSQGFNQLGSQFADCCCENRLANCQTQNIIQNEGNQTRFADANNTRDIIQNQTAGTQAILDKLCSLELDNYRRENDQLRTQLNMANLTASQTAQTAQIRDGQNASVAALVNELRSCPIPSQPVYGSQPIFTCPNNNNGCGCNCGCGMG